MSPRPWVDASQATLFGEGSKPRDRKPRERDELFDALVYVTKTNPAGLTASGRGMLNRALKELRAVGATPEEIVNRSRVYVEKWRHTPTAGALSRQWATLEESPLAARKVPQRPAHGVSAEARADLAARMRAWMQERQ